MNNLNYTPSNLNNCLISKDCNYLYRLFFNSFIYVPRGLVCHILLSFKKGGN